MGASRVFKKEIIFLLFALLFLGTVEVSADTLYLKNGRTIEGFVAREDDDIVELQLDSGVIKFDRPQVIRIYKSNPQESEAIRRNWNAVRQRSVEVRKENERQPQQLDLIQSRGHVVANALLNKKVSARLLLDTGASFVVITNKIAEELGIDYKKQGRAVNLVVADGRLVNARLVILDSVSVESSKAENVEAAVVSEGGGSSGFQDGLLGMSFLKNFNFKIDYDKEKLILEKLR